jgi:hypothetical protein
MLRLFGWNRFEVSHFLGSFHRLIIIDIEKELGVAEPPLTREHPSSTLYDAAKLLIQTHARRLPLLDYDTETGHEIIVSVLTQYRLLKFISINVCCIQLSYELISSPLSSAPRKFNSYIFLFANLKSEHTSLHPRHQMFQKVRILTTLSPPPA